MSHTIVNPVGLHNSVGFGYSHIATVSGELVLIAGQYASDAGGDVPTDDFADQVDLSLANLGTALEAVGLTFEHVVQIRTFVVGHDLAKLEIIAERVGRIWGDRPPTQTLLGVAALALPGMRFEIDAIAARP